jgi:hypothetical protein
MKSGNSTSTMPPEVQDLIRSTVQRIRSQGGKVVGLIGFSQGTKVVAGLLLASQITRTLGKLQDPEFDWLDFDFALSVCGSYPPPLLPPCVTASLDPSEELLKEKIRVPAFHVQGKQDEWKWAGEGLIGCYEVGEGMSVVKEWEMGHHYPVQAEESKEIGEWMVGVLKGVGGEREGDVVDA